MSALVTGYGQDRMNVKKSNQESCARTKFCEWGSQTKTSTNQKGTIVIESTYSATPLLPMGYVSLRECRYAAT